MPSAPRFPFARLAACGLWGAVCLLPACSGDEQSNLRPTAKVERGPIERTVVATGTIEPENEVEVRPRISGIVEKIHVDPGEVVEAGQVLLEIDRELIEVRAREAEARIVAAQVELDDADRDLGRVAALLESGAATDEERDDARSRRDRLRAEVRAYQAALEALNVQLRHATVRAPDAGKILDVYVEEGSAVSAVTTPTGGTPLLAIAGTSILHLKGLVDENEVSRVAIGQKARIRTEAFGDRVFEGVVREIAPIGERRQNVTYFEVEIELTGKHASLLRPRMSGDAEVVTEVIADALLIPETALRYDADRVYVELALDGDATQAERREISIGIVGAGRVEVTDGLEPGLEVLLQ